MFKFLSECLLYETMVELLGELTSPLLLLHGTDYDCLHNQERNMSNTGRDTHSLTRVLCPQSLSKLFNSRRVFWHVNISLLCYAGKNILVGGILSALFYGPLQTIFNRLGNFRLTNLILWFKGGGGYFIRRYQNEYKIRNEILKKRGKEKKLKKKKKLFTHMFFLADQKTTKKNRQWSSDYAEVL